MLFKKQTAKQSQRFRTLVHHFHADLYRYAYWLCGHIQQAEDLVQESFLRAWKSLDSLRDDAAAKAWLITILRREYARQFAQRPPAFVDIETQETLTADVPGQDVENFGLRRAIAKLPLEYREPLILQIVGGFSQAEIATLLALKENTVAVRLFRARQRLKSWYTDIPSADRSKEDET